MPETITSSPEETRSIGAAVGLNLAAGDLVCLEGDLGSGKTTFVQGLAHGWGSSERVTSPTFVLVNEYRRPDGARLYHMDAYRLNGPGEAEDLDLDALLDVGPLVVEWADRVRSALPAPKLTVAFTNLGGDRRRVAMTSPETEPQVRPDRPGE